MQRTIREPGSAITHFIAMILAALAAMPLLLKTASEGSGQTVAAMAIFVASMILLYGASALYHSLIVKENILKVFRKIDHMMIFILIAGSYTPVCVTVLAGQSGRRLLAAVWGIAAAGMIFKAVWVNCPKWVSSILYIALGWACIFVFGQLFEDLSREAFDWLLAGGVIYTVGGVIYALKLPLFNSRHTAFGSHEIFHLFVMAGSFCHFIFMYQYVA